MTQVKYRCDTVTDMTTTATTEEQWLCSPLVQYAIEKSGTDAPAVDILSTLSDVLNELEERCPGVPFQSILAGAAMSATKIEKRTSAICLLSLGMEEAVITDLLGIETDVTLMLTTKLSERTPDPSRAFQADRDAGLTAKQIAQKWEVTPRTVFRYLGAPKRAVAALVAS